MACKRPWVQVPLSPLSKDTIEIRPRVGLNGVFSIKPRVKIGATEVAPCINAKASSRCGHVYLCGHRVYPHDGYLCGHDHVHKNKVGSCRHVCGGQNYQALKFSFFFYNMTEKCRCDQNSLFAFADDFYRCRLGQF